jgi:hypothetical protein
MIWSASRIGIPATPPTDKRAAVAENSGAGRLDPHVSHPNHRTGLIRVATRTGLPLR